MAKKIALIINLSSKNFKETISVKTISNNKGITIVNIFSKQSKILVFPHKYLEFDTTSVNSGRNSKHLKPFIKKIFVGIRNGAASNLEKLLENPYSTFHVSHLGKFTVSLRKIVITVYGYFLIIKRKLEWT